MDYELPTEFDLIVVGTGVVESVVSAAASRIGKRVLHIDSKNYYGGQWASFNLDSLQKLDVVGNVETAFQINERLDEGDHLLPIGNNLFDLKDFSIEWHIAAKVEETEPKDDQKNEKVPVETPEIQVQWTQESLLKESRKFNIDLTPKLQFARGDFVELLISSNIARYSEYRSVSRVLTWLNDQLEIVPCSRSDVFANNKVSVIEKRMLMKLFALLDSEEENKLNENENKTFRSYLKEKKLSDNLIHYVLYAIAMSNDDTPCLEGVQRTKRFMNSLGRFGKTPFLFSMYGSGEITQAFCRLSAVFGATYALNQPLNGLIFSKDDDFKGLICGKQRILAENLVIGTDKAPNRFVEPHRTNSYISRAILITDKSIMEDEKEHLTLLLYPPRNGKNSITVLELGTLTGTCPKDLFLVHLISRSGGSPKDDLKSCVDNLFHTDDNRPNIIWSCYFSLPDTNHVEFADTNMKNLYICPGPDLDLDYDHSIKKAKKIFNKMYPGTEFLPRAPDPDEIIIGDDDDSTEDFGQKNDDRSFKNDPHDGQEP